MAVTLESCDCGRSRKLYRFRARLFKGVVAEEHGAHAAAAATTAESKAYKSMDRGELLSFYCASRRPGVSHEYLGLVSSMIVQNELVTVWKSTKN
jgi:hypothetical protein